MNSMRLFTGSLYGFLTVIAVLLIIGGAHLSSLFTPAQKSAPAAATAPPRPAPTGAANSSPATADATPPPPPPAAGVIAPTVEPTPTPRPAGTPPRVGLQVGHWKTDELPDELARLRTSYGTSAGGYTELQINLDITPRIAALLEAEGVVVDVLPATVPPGYDADAFITIHADGSTNLARNGFKLATPWRTSQASRLLHDLLREEYATATGMPWDDGITTNMRGYYAFSYTRYEHTIARTTPAVIVEMGFLTNDGDRAILTTQQDQLAQALANGILRYLRERDPNDGAALIPPEPVRYSVNAGTSVPIYASKSTAAAVVLQAPPASRITSFNAFDGWHEVFVRTPDEQRMTGWVVQSDLDAHTQRNE